MQKVDRLGWAAGFSFEAYGLLIGVRASRPEVLEALRARLPFGWTPSEETEVDYVYSVVAGGPDARGRVRKFHILFADAVQIGRSMDWEMLLDGFEKDVELFVGERAHGKVFVHAGVVGWKGRAILLPGKSLAGKSTLVAELVRAGATYFSDEFAILDEKGFVHPFRRPLELRKPGDTGSEKFAVEGLTGAGTPDALPVGCVLAAKYRAGAGLRPKPLSPGAACLEILQHTLSARSQPELVLPALQAVANRARCYKAARGEAAEVAAALLALAESA